VTSRPNRQPAANQNGPSQAIEIRCLDNPNFTEGNPASINTAAHTQQFLPVIIPAATAVQALADSITGADNFPGKTTLFTCLCSRAL
jgi:hypothetical protein